MRASIPPAEPGVPTAGGSDCHAEEYYGIRLTEYGVTEEGFQATVNRINPKMARAAQK